MKRRTLLQLSALAAAGSAAAQPALLTRRIPSTGEQVPAMGLGTWITFNVGQDPPARAQCVQVMRAFAEGGGRIIDSSPMYGSAQGVIGEGVRALGPQRVFSADKVWTSSDGAAQAEASRQLWQVPRFDLLQVHNLLAWEKQLPLLQRMKEAGQLRYVGITTSEGRRHREFEQLMRNHKLDFVQFTYNLFDREAEERLLPLAAERGIAVLVNRPFQEGALVRRLQKHPLPAWAADIECKSWAQVALKFVISHPAVTCAIPATRRVDHVRENLAAARGRMPDEAMRRRMAAHVATL
ncbi:MAG TPA: aldo/keto reductase [Ramlibacter sp.]|jgi:diketogulonate reductase-like aldo/keto reductase|nr:aldo/keto reductase [Ramlibacter sp.]